MNRTTIRSLLLVPVALACLGAGASEAPSEPPVRFALGEKLWYDARVWKGFSFLGMKVGTTTLEVLPSDVPEWPEATLFRARARGGSLGYKLRGKVDTYFDPATGLPLLSEVASTGTEEFRKRMRFEGAEGTYLRWKHCRVGQKCRNPDHIVSVKKSRGLFRGSERVRRHCRDMECGDRRHGFWQVRHEHEFDRPTFDMLSVLYVCRGMDLPLGGPGERIRIVGDHDLWDVVVRAVKREKIKVPAGTFRTLKIEIRPKPAGTGTKLRKELKGLFGIRGKIQIWVDEARRIPVKIRGTVPFGVDLNMEISLTRKRIPSHAS